MTTTSLTKHQTNTLAPLLRVPDRPMFISVAKARVALANATTLLGAKRVKDVAEAMKVWARAQKDGAAVQRQAAEIVLRAERRLGELIEGMEKLKPKEAGSRGGRGKKATPKLGMALPAGKQAKKAALAEVGISTQRASEYKAVAELPAKVFEAIVDEATKEDCELSTAGVLKVVRDTKREERHEEARERIAAEVRRAPEQAIIRLSDSLDFLDSIPDESADLLLTDPPYMTDVGDRWQNIEAFVHEWVPRALLKVKPTGRAYICAGAYPRELHAYLKVLLDPAHRYDRATTDWVLANVLVWTYRNTIGPATKYDYRQNWQAVFYLHGRDAPALNAPELNELFAVQDINAPDGRVGDRVHEWQKPGELGERFIRHSTKAGDLVVDPFAGTGTFLIAAAKLGRRAIGCDLDPKMIKLAVERGCVVE